MKLSFLFDLPPVFLGCQFHPVDPRQGGRPGFPTLLDMGLLHEVKMVQNIPKKIPAH